MSLIREVNKKEVCDFIKSLKNRIKEESPSKNIYSSVYDIINFSTILGESPQIRSIGAIIKEGFFPFGKTIMKVIVPGEIRMDIELYKCLQQEINEFRNKYPLAYFRK